MSAWWLAVAQAVAFLPAETTAPDLSASASRNAPVLEYAYGPRAQAGLGHELALLGREGDSSSWRLALGVFIGLENSRATGIGPHQVWRDVEELTWFYRGRDSAFEVGLGFGHLGARASESANLESPESDDIPFGGGGYYLKPSLSYEQRGESWGGVALAESRFFTNLWPELVGQKEASDTLTDTMGEGLSLSPALEGSLRYLGWGDTQPVVSARAQLLLPADDSARTGWLLRGLLGLALVGEHGSLIPHLALEAGNGQGLLINRRELRMSGGLRYAL